MKPHRIPSGFYHCAMDGLAHKHGVIDRFCRRIGVPAQDIGITELFLQKPDMFFHYPPHTPGIGGFRPDAVVLAALHPVILKVPGFIA